MRDIVSDVFSDGGEGSCSTDWRIDHAHDASVRRSVQLRRRSWAVEACRECRFDEGRLDREHTKL